MPINYTMDPKDEQLVKKTLRWFAKNGRKFNWRGETDPYKILIAELMLQKTNADVVKRVHPTFIKKYPNPSKLKAATLNEVIDILRPLGLHNRRSRNIKKIATELVQTFGGAVPENLEKLITLPGIGRYTANAVLCFAYEEDVPIVDANIARVIGRFYSLDFNEDLERADNIWRKVEDILPKGKCKEFNWALLDLGGTVCKPRNPNCTDCPIQEMCDKNF